MDGDAGVGGAGSARDEANTDASGRLSIAFRHKAGAAFLAVGNELDLGRVYQSVDDGDVALARHTENMPHAFVTQTLSYRMAAEHRFVSSCDLLLLFLWSERFRLKRAVAFLQECGETAFFLGVFETFVEFFALGQARHRC